MKKLLGIIVLGLLFSVNAYADRVVTFKCTFERDNYEYLINWYQDKYNELYLNSMPSKKSYYYDNLKSSVELTVINKTRSYNFKGFKNNRDHSQHYFIFLDGPNSVYAWLVATKFDTGRAVELDITSHDNAIDLTTKGTCKAIY